ncbi:MAG: hypothetical protein ACPGSB_05045 [Opitutales bacterium]
MSRWFNHPLRWRARRHGAKYLPLSLGLICLGALSLGVVPPEELEATKPQLEITRVGSNLLLEWESRPDVYYFMEGAADLESGSWVTAKLLKDNDATGSLSLGTSITGSMGFFRLSLDGDPYSVRLSADDDGDRIINRLEADAGWDAFLAETSPDSDGDGIPDYFELFYFGGLQHDGSFIAVAGGADLATAFAHALVPHLVNADEDEWTDLQEIKLGFNVNYDQSRDNPDYARDGDLDGDRADNQTELVANTDATDPDDTPPPAPRYAVIDLGQSGGALPNRVSNHGHVLLDNIGTLTAYRWSFNSGMETLAPTGQTWAQDMNREGIIVGGISNTQFDPYWAAGDETLAAYWPVNQTQAVMIQNQYPADGVSFANALINAVNANGQIMGTRITDLDTGTRSTTYPCGWSGTLTDGFQSRLDNLQARDVQYYRVAQSTYATHANIFLDGRAFRAHDMNTSGNWVGLANTYTAPADYTVQPDGTSDFYNPPDSHNDDLHNGTDIEFWAIEINDDSIMTGRNAQGIYGMNLPVSGFRELPNAGRMNGISDPVANQEPLRIVSRYGLFVQKESELEDINYDAVSAETPFDFWSFNQMINPPDGPKVWNDIRGMAISSNGNFITAVADDANGTAHALLLLKMDLEWISKDEANNPIDENPNEGGGKRYYPGKLLPIESNPRNIVTLKLSIPGLAGKKVDLKAFDVDDPTEDSSQVVASDVDTNGDSGNDNFNDYLSTPQSGQFVLGTAAATTRKVTLDANGEAEVDFQVGMQPGNNYRVVATLEDYPGNFDQLQVSDSSSTDTFVTADDEPISGFTGAGAVSPMLTVWRKLHIEQDSMGPLPDPMPTHDQNILQNIVWGSVSTSGQTTIDLVASIPYSGTLDNDFYRDGYTWPSGGNRASAYEVSSNARAVGDQDITLIGSPTSSEQSTIVWNIVDDDNRGLSAENLPVLSRLNLISDSVKLKYEPAYITVIDVDTMGLNPNKIVDFDANLSWFEQTYNTGSVNDAEDLSAHADDEAFWNQLVVASYQGGVSGDNDPANEGGGIDAGVNVDNVFSEKYATVFLEGVRETFYAPMKSTNPSLVAAANAALSEEIAKVVAHEIGHSPEGSSGIHDHDEGGLMDANYGPSDFSGITIKRFRQAESWR